MSQPTWREAARSAIRKCLAEHNPQTAIAFKQIVATYYPFAERRMYPYKVWLEEVNKEAQRIEHQPTPADIRNYWLNPPLQRGRDLSAVGKRKPD